MGTIILFYKYISIDDPHGVMRWQQKLTSELGLKGRIILAREGINGTLGGDTERIEQYKNLMLDHPLFTNIDFKEAPGNESAFIKMRIVVKKEIVRMDLDPQQCKAADGGIHLKPRDAHTMISEKPTNLVLLDARNSYESRIGTFAGAITPNIYHFRDLPAYIDNNLEQFKDKKVVMFCTGGIRCERASAYLKSKGVTQEVYQIEGGIHRYIEQFPNGHFRGKNYVFDGRLSVKVTDDILGSCALCGKAYDEYNNCMNASCNKHFIGCPPCIIKYAATCSQKCQELLSTNQVHQRPPRMKVSF